MHKILRVAAHVVDTVVGRIPAGRGLTVFPDDVFLVSYPKSGNTWTRFLIGNLVYPDRPVTFLNIESLIPEISLNPDHLLRHFPRPRILKSHECFDPRYPRVVYIVRDPRDVAVSHYHYNMKRRNIPEGYPLDDYIPRFMVSEFNPRIGSWGDHVMSWLCLRENRSDFLLLYYEDMLQNTQRELTRIASFLKEAAVLETDPAPERIARAVEQSSTDRMRRLEKTQGDQWKMTKGSRQDKPLVRAATASGWKSALSANSVSKIEEAWGPVMLRLGYSLSTSAGNSAAPVASPRRSSVP